MITLRRQIGKIGMVEPVEYVCPHCNQRASYYTTSPQRCPFCLEHFSYSFRNLWYKYNEEPVKHYKLAYGP